MKHVEKSRESSDNKQRRTNFNDELKKTISTSSTTIQMIMIHRRDGEMAYVCIVLWREFHLLHPQNSADSRGHLPTALVRREHQTVSFVQPTQSSL